MEKQKIKEWIKFFETLRNEYIQQAEYFENLAEEYEKSAEKMRKKLKKLS